MKPDADARSDPPVRMLEFRSGGWVLALAAVLVVAVVAQRVYVLVATYDRRAQGDGVHVESYGFDLSTLLVAKDILRPIGRGMPRDGLPALVEPATVAASESDAHRKLNGVRKLLASDRVIGVALSGAARAYPIWILDWHELVNDVVGGVPILVSWSGVCGSAVVFDRRVAGETLAFHFSGLMLNSNLVFYDSRPEGIRASLWSQLQLRAISGPAAERGATLEVLPASLTTWSAWRERHPETSVLLPDPARKRVYKRQAYSTYLRDDELRFPVQPLPTTSERRLKSGIVAVREGGAWRIIDQDDFTPHTPEDRETVYSFWFAWYALRATIDDSPQ